MEKPSKEIYSSDRVKHKEPSYEELVNLYLEHCYDNDGNILSLDQLKFDEDFAMKLEKLTGDDTFWAPDFAVDNKFNNQISNKLKDKNFDFNKKIALINLYVDMIIDLSDQNIGSNNGLKKFKQISNNKSLPLMIKIYAQEQLEKALIHTGAILDEQNESVGKGRPSDIFSMHDKRFNRFSFIFNEQMCDKINEERWDDHYYKSLTPIEWVQDEFTGEYRIEGDYITCALAPGIVGIYSREGSLIGWQDISELKEDLTDNSGLNQDGYINIDFQPTDNPMIHKLKSAREFKKITTVTTSDTLDLKDRIPLANKFDLVNFKLLSALPIRQKINHEFDIDLAALNLRTQYQLLDYIKNKSEHEILGLKKYLGLGDEKSTSRINRLKSFLSVEFDMRAGDKLLSISAKLPPEQAEKIINIYTAILDTTFRLSSSIARSKHLKNSSLDGRTKDNINNNLSDALMRRATDILTTAHLLTDGNHVAVNNIDGRKIEVKNISEVIEALEIYSDILTRIEILLNNDAGTKFNLDSRSNVGGVTIYNLSSADSTAGKYKYFSISLRGEGTNNHNTDIEYDGEARINFLFNDQPIPLEINQAARSQAISIRLDRECFIVDENDRIVSRDNTIADGRLSLDLGSLHENSGQENQILSRSISIGNYYNNLARKKKPEFYHNKESFYQDLGQANNFKQIVDLIEDIILSKYSSRPTKAVRDAA